MAGIVTDVEVAAPSVPDTTLAWLAALIDGEGSIMLNDRRTGKESGSPLASKRGYVRQQFRPQVIISGTEPKLFRALADKTGIDRVYEHKRPERLHHKSRTYTWRLVAQEQRLWLPLLLPWLVIKDEQASLLIEALEIKDRLWSRPGSKCSNAERELGHDRLQEIYLEIRRLNTRGRYAGGDAI